MPAPGRNHTRAAQRCLERLLKLLGSHYLAQSLLSLLATLHCLCKRALHFLPDIALSYQFIPHGLKRPLNGGLVRFNSPNSL